jgi:spermidine synthase
MLKYVQAANESVEVVRKIDEVLAHGRTQFQEYLFFRSAVHGVCIALNGDIQSCESDEAIYHEALVHPAMLLHANPRRVLIMGGGEGATAREALRHNATEKVVMVDIDREFVDLCRRHVPHWSAGAFTDPRLTIHYQDINTYLENCRERFDVAIGDLVDAPEIGAAAALYSAPFYKRLKRCLNDGAVVASQAGSLPPNRLDRHNRLRAALRTVFKHVESYGVVVPSFYDLWGFVIASDVPLGVQKRDKFLHSARERGVSLPALGAAALAAAFVLPRMIADNLS